MPEHVISPLLNLSAGRLLDLKIEWGTSMQAVLERAYRLGRVTMLSATTRRSRSPSAGGCG